MALALKTYDSVNSRNKDYFQAHIIFSFSLIVQICPQSAGASANKTKIIS